MAFSLTLGGTVQAVPGSTPKRVEEDFLDDIAALANKYHIHITSGSFTGDYTAGTISSGRMSISKEPS